MDPETIVATLAAGMRFVLGELPGEKKARMAKSLLAAQVRLLGRQDGDYGPAVMKAATGRLEALVGNAEAREKMLGCEYDPDHLYGVLVLPDQYLRRLALTVIDPPQSPTAAMFMAVKRRIEQGDDEDGE